MARLQASRPDQIVDPVSELLQKLQPDIHLSFFQVIILGKIMTRSGVSSMGDLGSVKIAVIGLGYVGLPLAVEFCKQYSTIGFDIKADRISELASGQDSTLEVTTEQLQQADRLSFSTNTEDLAQCNVYIVTAPTPIDEYKRPDLSPLLSASKTVGQALSKGDIVVFESTVYPGATALFLPVLILHQV